MRHQTAEMMEASTVFPRLALFVALLVAGIPTSAQADVQATSSAVPIAPPMAMEHPSAPQDDSGDPDDCTVFLPLIHSPSPYPASPPQIEPAAGEHFLCPEGCDTDCTGSVSNWLLVDYDVEYDVWGGGPCLGTNYGIEPGDPVIEVTARIKYDSEVAYWTWATGTSYDAEGNRLTGTISPTPSPFPNRQLVDAHGTGAFTFHMNTDHVIVLIRIAAACASVIPLL